MKKLYCKKMNCKLSEKVLTCPKTGVSKKHQEKVKMTMKTSPLPQMINQVTTADATNTMEVKLCGFIAQHNLPCLFLKK